MSRRLLRPYWPAVLGWGCALLAGTASVTALVSWSWRGVGLTAAATLVIFAALVLAISVFGKDG